MSMSADLWTVRRAIECLPESCRYHGRDFGRLGYEGPNGEPRCESCRPAWRRMCGLAAVDRMRDEGGRERSPDPDTPAKRLASLHAQPHFPNPSCPPTCHCYGTAGFQQWAADGHGESDAQRRERSDPEGSSKINPDGRRSLTEDTP